MVATKGVGVVVIVPHEGLGDLVNSPRLAPVFSDRSP